MNSNQQASIILGQMRLSGLPLAQKESAVELFFRR
jgi:hypothetical protein